MGLGGMASKKVWIVGARDTCDIVVDQPTVSGEHCRLEFDEGRVFIEDLQSTNGTFVNGERIFKRKQIHPDALVTLGKSVTMPMPSQLSTPAAPPKRPTPPPEPSPQNTEEELSFPLHLLIGSSVAAAVLVLLVVLVIVLWGGNSDPTITDTDSTSIENQDDGSTAANTVKIDPSQSNPVSQTVTPTGKREDAIYVIAVANADKSQIFRIGTGVAVGPHTILTSSTVNMVSKLLSEKFPQVILLGDKQLTITKFTPHPTYVASFEEAEQAKAKFDQIYAKIESTNMDQLSDELTQTLEDAYRNYMIIAEKPSHYDVAAIQVQESLPYWLPIAKTASLTPKERLTLLGHGYDRLAPFYPPNNPLPITETTTRVRNTSGVAGDLANARLVIAGFDSADQTNLHLETNWNGSPLLNSQFELVALYSRPTPELTLGTPPTGQTFDATVVIDVMPFVSQFTNN